MSYSKASVFIANQIQIYQSDTCGKLGEKSLFWVSGSLLLLSSIAIDDGPVHSYNYSSTTSYGVVETFDGDHFYLMNHDMVSL